MNKCYAVYGVGGGIDGREAALQATQRVLDQVGAARPALGIVFVSQEFDVEEVVGGVLAFLGDVPLWGFSTVRPITEDGDAPRTVVVALLMGSELRAQVHFWSEFAHDSSGVARLAAQILRQESFTIQESLFVADGINGSLTPLCAALENSRAGIAGCMASGDQAAGKTYQIGKNQCAPGSLSMALFGGRFRLGVGLGQGWRSVGAFFRATHTRDVWVQALDGAPAIDSYVRYFGHTAREWTISPLMEMARLYPLGVEGGQADGGMLLRSILRVEVDGSLRMSAPVPEGAVVHLMIGDPETCLREAEKAVTRALADLGESAKPMLAIAFVDVSWGHLFENHPNQVALALKSALGDIPLIGAYTLGQVVQPAVSAKPVVHNQAISVVIIGEAVE